MRIVRYASANFVRIGLTDETQLQPISASSIAQAVASAAKIEAAGEPVGLDAVELLPPIDDTAKIVCVGLNYVGHAREVAGALPDYPALFMRTHDSLAGHGQAVLKPKVSDHYDFEGELAVMIGRAGRRIPAAEAFDFIGGFLCFGDHSIRDFQQHTDQATAGKNFHRSGAAGPWVAVSAKPSRIAEAPIVTRLNGETVQSDRLSNLIFDIPYLVNYVSTVTPLRPGDVIATGTPSGVGFKRTPPLWMRPGDVIEVAIEGVGTLSNVVSTEA